jgi:hypothetical protein
LARERLFELFLLIVFSTGLSLKTRALVVLLLKLSSSSFPTNILSARLYCCFSIHTSSHDLSLSLLHLLSPAIPSPSSLAGPSTAVSISAHS